MTIKALRCLEKADVVVYDRLVSKEILALIPAGARLINVGKTPGSWRLPQESINALLVQLVSEGVRRVVRLKGGDPLIFGRGSEEAAVLREAGIAYEYVPGITSAQGVAMTTGVALTHRGLATSVRYITGHRAKDARLDLDWPSLVSPDTTLVVYMGSMNIAEIAHQLMDHGMSGDTPALAVASATRPDEAHALATVATLSEAIQDQALTAPILIIIGQVVTLYGSGQITDEDILQISASEARYA